MDEHPLEEQNTEKTGLDSLLARLYRPGPLIVFFTLAFVCLSAIGYAVLTDDTPPPARITNKAPQSATASLTPPKTAPIQPEQVQPEPRVYEEDTSSVMEDMVRQADLAIIETMRSLEMDMQELDLLDVELRDFEGKGYHYQVLQLPAVHKETGLLKQLRGFLAKRVPKARISISGTNELVLSISGVPTHRLLLETVPLTVPKPKLTRPKLAIVIDDIGEDMKVLTGLVNLDFPVTLAVWPYATHTRRSVDLIQAKKRDLIIHFPMEPKGYPRYNPGKDALFVAMTADQIRQQIARSVTQIPEAIGVNNHMGSKFTSSSSGMNVALGSFKNLGLFFLDSLTTSKSVARKSASKTGIPFYERDIFIDNVKDVSAIIHQLNKAENVTFKQGYAIAIGHPYPETLAALRRWGASRNQAVEVVPLSNLAPQ